jgi:hypothetical protein
MRVRSRSAAATSSICRSGSRARSQCPLVTVLVDGDTLPSPHLAVEANRAAVDEDDIDLGVRHADRLDSVLRRGRARYRSRETPLAQPRRQVVVQFLVEAELARARAVVHVAQPRVF